jgi:hypothetical protein
MKPITIAILASAAAHTTYSINNNTVKAENKEIPAMPESIIEYKPGICTDNDIYVPLLTCPGEEDPSARQPAPIDFDRCTTPQHRWLKI